MKRFVVSLRGAKDKHGVAAASLQEFNEKAIKQLDVDPMQGPIALVLAEDGTIVEDEDYFLCLPEDTEFVLLTGNKKWSPCMTDGGTMWMARESIDQDDVDGSLEIPRWKVLAAQLKQNLSNIILFSESDFQALIDVQTEELSREIAIPVVKAEMLKDTLQCLLDRRQEERQSKELLQLYLKAVNKDGTDASTDETDSKRLSQRESDQKTQLSSHVITILREKTSPYLSLSNEQLEAVCAQDTNALSVDLNQSLEHVRNLQASCAEQLQQRYEQVQRLNSLSSASQAKRQLLP
ncbi:DNA fragmentation factor subunit alpha isoform X2 [Hyla sarda]|uniref:DNA fragmentation factor subunit alpha isoform X2 n=1 Tax=Hyla sarda TaxID=327740 RepID=UPI0024C2238D|nr:DNA fragmentation factor subunit alpha isoform X2 [Hyla sarda]